MVGSARFRRFVLVGSAGFLVDTGLLSLLHHGLGIDPFSARLVSVVAATVTTWRLNRGITFGASGATQTAEAIRYALVTAATVSINYLVYACALTLVAGMPPVVAVMLGASVAMGFTYAGYSRFVFSGARATSLGAPRLQRR